MAFHSTSGSVACRAFLALVAALLLYPGVIAAAKIRVEIVGVTDELEKNVEALLSIEAARKDKPGADVIRALHDGAPKEIALALQPFGYYRPEITPSLEADEKGNFTARYVIVPGDPLRVDGVSLQLSGEAADQTPFSTVAKNFPLKTGDVLVHGLYEKGKAAFANAAADSGYLDARFDTTEIRVDLVAYAASIVIHFDTGPRYKFGEVTFDQDIVDERILRNFVGFKPGQLYRLYKLTRMQQAILSSPYFGQVEIVPRRDLAENRIVPIEVTLAPRKTQRYEVGVGFGTDTGPRIKFSMELRRLNRRGHQFETGIDASFVEQSWHATYTMPAVYPRRSVYSAFTGYALISTATSESNKFIFGSNRVLKRWGWVESLSLAWEWEDYTVGSDTSLTELLIPGASLAWKRADDDIMPRHGETLRLEARGGHKDVLSDVTFLLLVTRGKLIRGLGSRFRFIARAEVGRTFTDAFRQLPPSIRFFSGGDQTVRGYEYLSLGPKDEAGNVIGGSFLLVSGAELEMHLAGKWGVAAFFDAGNALAEWNDPLEYGAGLGVRWASPVGPIRLDWARTIDHHTSRVHFWIGPDL